MPDDPLHPGLSCFVPPHAPDILSVRIQAIDRKRTSTFLDLQPCRPLRVPHEPNRSWFPSPATSNGACRFPALRSPARFARRFMGSSQLVVLSILMSHQHLLHTIQPLPSSSSCISSVSGLADCRVFLSDAPASHHCQRNYETAGFLRSLGITPVHRCRVGGGVAEALASVRRSNCTDGVPACYVLEHIRCVMWPPHLCGAKLVWH
jgi:hypothetical protein